MSIDTQALALKYRPKTFSDLTEQKSVVKILTYMIENKCFPNVMLFCGAAGTGKTTSARIMASLINNGQGTPIEIDAASNNSVDNMRKIIEESKFKSIDAKYKIYILDEVHQFSNAAWQSFLKTCEEPPSQTIFILCTTDPQKIPMTIHSRVQKFYFNRITYKGIIDRLKYICDSEIKNGENIIYDVESLDYIAKLSNGGMRDAITHLDKALNYSKHLTIENVIEALGVHDYEYMFNLINHIINKNEANIIELIENVYLDGKDLKVMMSQFIDFLLDISKYYVINNFTYIQIPETYKSQLDIVTPHMDVVQNVLDRLLEVNKTIKYESSPKTIIEANLLLLCR